MTQQYVLLRTYFDRMGNVYHKRTAPYLKEELPQEIIDNNLYCVPLHTGEIVDVKPIFRPDTDSADFSAPGSTTREVKHKPLYSERNISIKKVEPVFVGDIDLNSASVEVIAGIRGVGAETAAKLVTERESRMFSSIEDVQFRIPLPFGRQWSKLTVPTTDTTVKVVDVTKETSEVKETT